MSKKRLYWLTRFWTINDAGERDIASPWFNLPKENEKASVWLLRYCEPCKYAAESKFEVFDEDDET